MRKVGAVVLMAAVLGFAVGGSSNASTERTRFVRLPGRGARPAFVPMSARPTTSVIATVRLAGAPVVVRATADGAAADGATPAAVASDDAARRDVLASQQAVTDLVTRLGGEVLYRLTDTANAVVVRVPEDQLAALGAGPGVVAVDQSRQVERDNTVANNYTGASVAWQSLGLTGRGQKIAIIDDGVDYNHADFGGSGNPADTLNDDGLTIGTPNFPSAKVAGGYDFVGDAYDASAPVNDPARVPHPDPDPLSCGTHGTHVAGTAAGMGVTADGRTFTGPYTPAAVATLGIDGGIGPGAAPEATIYAYKVFGCDGSTNNAIVAAAIDRAVADGVDVISLSLGSPYGSTTSIEAEAVDNAVAAGVTVVASAGNDGANAYLVDTPSSADGAISVAALDASLPEFSSAILRLPTEVSAIVANDARFSTLTGTVRVITDAASGAPTAIGLGCNPGDYSAVRPGDIVVVKRGTCTRTEKARLAAQAGAGAVILVNTQRGLPPYEGKVAGVTVPFLGVQPSAADALIAASGTALTITSGPTIPNGGYGQIATFSAGGPRNGDSAMKPDLAAPGVSIFSAAAGTGSGGLRESGTSMAVPHVAGVAALVHQARPAWTPAQVKAALMNTADPTAARIRGINQRVAGTGVLDAVRAVSTAVVATTADGTNALSFGYRPARAGLSPSKSFTITNHGTTTATYDLTTEFNGGTGADRGAVVDISPQAVTVAPGASVEVAVTLSMSAATVAKLPGASQPAGSIVLVRGTVTATPREAGLVPLRMPFGLVPRGLSDLRAEITTPLAVSGTTATGTMDLSNRGIHRGTADVYAWLLADNADHDAVRSTVDIRSVGVQTYPGFLLDPSAKDDLAVVFAVNVEEAWSTASTGEIDLPIDVNGDGQYDVTVVGADFGAVMNGSDDGRFAAIVFDRSGTVLSAFVADAPMNGSTVLLPALASDLGLSATSPAFTVRAQSFDRINKVLDTLPGEGRWQPFRPAVSTGDLVDVTAASATTLPVRVDLAAQADQRVLGWLVVTLDDRNGESQADRVPLAGLLPPG